jgi:hypothetical protein
MLYNIFNAYNNNYIMCIKIMGVHRRKLNHRFVGLISNISQLSSNMGTRGYKTKSNCKVKAYTRKSLI